MDFIYCNDISYFAFPLNLIAFLFLLSGVWTLHSYYSHTAVIRWLTGIPATLLVIVLMIVLLIVEGIWALQLFKTWIFIFLELLFILILGLVIFKKAISFSIRTILFLFNHGGLWLTFSAGLFGAPDREEYKMIVPLYQEEYNAIDQNGILHPLPFTARLDRFELEYYSQQDKNACIPKRFCSTVTLKSKDREIQSAIEVNQPIRFKGYSLYQDGYDASRGADSRYSILLVVRDPWLGWVYAGILIMLAGSIGLIVCGPIKKASV